MSGMVENTGVEVGIAGPSITVEKLYPLPVLAVAILNVGDKPTSRNVGSTRDVSGVVANVGVAVGIVSPADCVQWLFPLPVSVAAILNLVSGRHRELSGNVESVISKAGLVENV